MGGGEEAGAVEVVVVRVDAEEGGGEDDEALVVLGAGQRVRVVPADSAGPEAGRATLIFHLQIFPVKRKHLNSQLRTRAGWRLVLTFLLLLNTGESGTPGGIRRW